MYNKQTLFRMVLFLPMFGYLFQRAVTYKSYADVMMFVFAVYGLREVVFTIQEILVPNKENK